MNVYYPDDDIGLWPASFTIAGEADPDRVTFGFHLFEIELLQRRGSCENDRGIVQVEASNIRDQGI